MSKLGAKTYNRKAECKATTQFDQLLSEKGNKPSTAKVSVAAVHRWGMTSFTSLRKAHLNGEKEVPKPVDTHSDIKRLKLEPSSKPSRDFVSDDPFGFQSVEIQNKPAEVKVQKKTTSSKPNKFFKSSARKNLGLVPGSKKNDFDSLCHPLTQTLPMFSDASISLEPSAKNGSSLSVEKSNRLFESLVQSKPMIVKDLHINTNIPMTLPFDDSVRTSIGYSERLPEQQPLFLVDPSRMKPSDMPLSELIHHVDEHKTDSFLSNSVISNLRTYDGSDFDQDLDKMDCVENVDAVGKELFVKQSVCDTIVAESSHLKPKYDGPSVKTDALSNAGSSQSNSPICVEKEGSSSLDEAPSNSEKVSNEQELKSKVLQRSKKIFNTSKKPKAVYNHRHWQYSAKNDDADSEQVLEKATSSLASEFDDFQNEETVVKPIVKEVKKSELSDDSIKTFNPVRQLYTVVRNVKQAYQCHESGETQEFNDDIEYLLEGIQAFNGIGTRCLSVLSFATKCMGAPFRVHLRAHGTMPKMFSALQDAPADTNLSLCTATLLFVLSQDRLTMDIEASTLSLMLQLLETDQDSGTSDRELALILEDPALCAMQEKHREKVFQLCEQMQQKGHAKHLKLDNINTGILAMETLLSLTSRKAGEWFKEEMRTLRGLDHIVDTITTCVESLLPEQTEVISKPSESQVDKVKKIDRCLRVLENVTFMNFENQKYLLNYKNCLLINYCASLMKLCKSHLLENQLPESEVGTEESSKHKPLSPMLQCLLSILKVLLNITFDNSQGCEQVGSFPSLMENVLMCILQVPKAVPLDKRFDLLVLSLGLMINLVEHCVDNRKNFMQMYSLGSFDTINDGYEILASEALVEVLLSRLDAAQQSEEQADELLSSQEVKQATTDKRDAENAASHAECLEETLMKTLQKAGTHMEHSLIAAYISLLLGCVIQNNQEFADVLKEQVPDGKFDIMIEVLKKFMSFVSLTGSVGNTGVKSIQRIIEVLSSS